MTTTINCETRGSQQIKWDATLHSYQCIGELLRCPYTYNGYTVPPTTEPTYHSTQPPITYFPSLYPSIIPSRTPTQMPSVDPTVYPSGFPTMNPSKSPSIDPSMFPSMNPSMFPTTYPSVQPSMSLASIIFPTRTNVSFAQANQGKKSSQIQ